MCDSKANPTILKETAATAFVDGNNGLGPVVGNFCMGLAIQKCKESGVGWVVAKGSDRYYCHNCIVENNFIKYL
jgi:LDH2 family malate/lactate/ureidoglycolate dehydrogenase